MPSARPDLHAHDGGVPLTEGGRIWPATTSSSLRERARVAAQHAVGRAAALDQPPVGLDELARVALGLVDRDRAQREVPADDDDGDREQAAQHEARDRRPGAGRGRADRPVLGAIRLVATEQHGPILHGAEAKRTRRAERSDATKVPLRPGPARLP